MKWFVQWLAERRARKQHAALIVEARRDWRVTQTYRVKCVWSSDRLAGFYVLSAEENGIGERRVRIIDRPPPPWEQSQPPLAQIWAELKEWEARAQSKSIPRKEVA